MPECNSCGRFVTTDLVRVFGDANGKLAGCLHCLTLTDLQEGGAISGSSYMARSHSVLGRCPHCGDTIPRSLVLIEHETEAGRARFAECPPCRDVVHLNDARSVYRSDVECTISQ